MVVTGASAGIGRAAAQAFARRGWRVALLAGGVDGLHGASNDVTAAGGEALVILTDVEGRWTKRFSLRQRESAYTRGGVQAPGANEVERKVVNGGASHE